MTACTRLSDRMLEIRLGGEWTPAEREHLDRCPDCAAEWRLMRAGAAVGAGLPPFDAARIAVAVRGRLAAEPPAPALLPFRARAVRLAIGLAAAAALILAVGLALRSRTAGVAPDSTAGVVVLSELEELSAGELEELLGALPAPVEVMMPSGAVGLSDLSAAELERVLAAWEG